VVKQYFEEPAKNELGKNFDVGKDWHKVVSGYSPYDDLLLKTCNALLEETLLDPE
jgi:hypothetical protein